MRNKILKIKKFYSHQEVVSVKFNGQQGVTLLLGLLIFTGVIAISFSVATIIFVEIKASGDVLRTEPSFYEAFASTEEALFRVKRNASVSTTTFLNNVTLTQTPQTLTPVENLVL